MNKNLPTLAVGDSVVIVLDNETQQSAVLTHFSNKGDTQTPHHYAHFMWKTGPACFEYETRSIHSSKWSTRVIAVFPKDAKFLAV